MQDALRDELTRLFPQNSVAALTTLTAAAEGLHGQIDVREHYGAVEVVTTLKGPRSPGEEGSPEARWLSLEIETPDLVLHTMHGGSFDNFTPPEAFSLRTRIINPRQVFPPTGLPPWINQIDFGSTIGRSSEEDSPFFLVSDPSGQSGLWFGVGWSGSWRASLKKEPNHRLWIYGAGCKVALGPGEQLELPRIFVGAWEGDGWAAVKRFLKSMCPRPTVAYVIYNTWFNRNADFTEQMLSKDAKAAADMGVEVFTLDATWYGGTGLDFAGPGLGTWEVDKTKLPNGLEALSKQVRDLGMKFGLWYEPERANPESKIALEHPDWVRKIEGDKFCLVDFGKQEVRDWAFGLMSSGVTSWGIDWLKWDFNMTPALWWGGDERAELDHVRGVYEVVDRLRLAHPNLLIEMCASGGNRIDLEMISRCESYWITDQTFITDILREFEGNVARVLPAQYRYTSITRRWASAYAAESGIAPVEEWDDYKDESFLTSMAGAFGIMEPVGEWSRKLRRRAARHIEEFKKVRHLLDENFTLFRDPGIPLTGWEAWEFATDTQAALFAFRQGSPDPARTFEGKHRWRIKLPDSGATLKTKGL